MDDMKTVDGTWKIHSVHNTGMEGVLEERMFMCCCEKCMFGVGECAFPDYSDEWKLVSVFSKRHLKSFVKSGRVGAIQKWRNTKTKSIHSHNQVSNLKRDECNPKSNVRKSARWKSSIVELDMDISKSKSSASNTATKTSKSTSGHTATKTAIMIATKVATMADGPFILDQKCNDCYPKSNVQKSARRKLSMVESDIDVSKIKSSASNTATKTSKSTSSHTATKTAIMIATKVALGLMVHSFWTKNVMIVTQKVMSKNQLGGS